MPFDRSLTTPKLTKDKKGNYDVTHNHAGEYVFYDGEINRSTRNQAHRFFKQGVKEVRACQAFFKEVMKGKNLSGVERATCVSAIRQDELLIEELDRAASKSSSCSIM